MENEIKKSIPVDEKTLNKARVVETFGQDMAKEIEKNEGGIIKKIIHEQEEKEAIKKNISPESKRNKIFILIGGILVCLAILLFASLAIIKTKISSVDVTTQFNPIIFSDKTSFSEIDGLNKDKIVGTILNEIKNTDVKNGGVEIVYLTENQKIVGFRSFIKFINSDLNLDKVGSNIMNDNFLIGVANTSTTTANIKGTNNLFFLLKVRSFFDTFPVLKDWENKMFYDLHGFFGIGLNTNTNYLLTKNFEDGIAGNKNARVLRDKDGNVVLEYIFADDNSVIIANNEQVVQEIIFRLSQKEVHN